MAAGQLRVVFRGVARSSWNSRSLPLEGRALLGKTGLKVTSKGVGCIITSDQTVIEGAADLGIPRPLQVSVTVIDGPVAARP